MRKIRQLHLGDKNIDINIQDEDGSTPLILATRKGRSDLVRILLRNGATISKATVKGETALSIAMQKGQDAILNELISAGASDVSIYRIRKIDDFTHNDEIKEHHFKPFYGPKSSLKKEERVNLILSKFESELLSTRSKSDFFQTFTVALLNLISESSLFLVEISDGSKRSVPARQGGN